jgi:hypothetical protein
MRHTIKNFKSRQQKLSLITVLWLSLFGFLTIAVPVSAQRDPTETRVKLGLEDLKNALAKAKEFLAAFEHREAHEFLAKAEAAFKDAEAKYIRALTLNDIPLRNLLLKDALANIALAKSYLDRAVKLISELPLTRLRNTLAELMRRAEQAVLAQPNREAQRLVYQARKNQLDAERAAMRDPRRAFELYQIAIALVNKALSLVEGPRLNERARYEELEARARDAVETGGIPAARTVLDQAVKQGLAAEEAYRKGDTATSQKLYSGAIRLLLRAISLAMSGQSGKDRIRNDIALLQDLIQNAEQNIQANLDPRASLLLARARVLVREAEAAMARQQPLEAKWRLDLARNFVDKALRKADRGAINAENFAQRFNEALQELARDLEEVGGRVREAGKPEAAALVDLAASAYKAAENAGKQNRLVFGFQLIRLAQHLLLRAETMLRDSATASATDTPTRETVLQQLAQTETTAQEISNTGGLESCQNARAQAVELLKSSRAAFERGQMRLAVAILEVANDLIENCVRK